MSSSQRFIVILHPVRIRSIIACTNWSWIFFVTINLPQLNGIKATIQMKKNDPDLKVIILTVHADEEYVFQILRAGACGYVLKSTGKKEIFAAIRSAVSGECFSVPAFQT